MTRRTTRSDALVDQPTLLMALAARRTAVIHEMVRMKAGGALYYSACAVVAAIDAVVTPFQARARLGVPADAARIAPQRGRD